MFICANFDALYGGAVAGYGLAGNAACGASSDLQALLYASTWHTLVSQATVEASQRTPLLLSGRGWKNYSRDIFRVEGFPRQRAE